MNGWFAYAAGAAVFYGLHQVFTKLASAGASDGLGGFVVEATAAATIAAYLAYLKVAGPWDQHIETNGLLYSIDGYLRGRRNRAVLPAVSGWGSARRGSRCAGVWLSHHGDRRPADFS